MGLGLKVTLGSSTHTGSLRPGTWRSWVGGRGGDGVGCRELRAKVSTHSSGLVCKQYEPFFPGKR